MYHQRLERVRASMAERAVDALLVSVGPDLPWLIGYEAMPLERLTMLVVPVDAQPTLVVPRLEAPRVVDRDGLFTIDAYDEGTDPVALVARLVGHRGSVAVGDRTWARFVLDLQTALAHTSWVKASLITAALRAVKDPAEIAALRLAGAAADRVASQLQAGEIALVGRTEAAVSADIGSRLLAEGHHRVNFAIVASGPNSASPHHEAGSRLIAPGEVVLCDFGGTLLAEGATGYCSDITRCISIGEPSREVADAYSVLLAAQQAAVAAAVVGTPCEAIDRVARSIITTAGFGDQFIHRTGHGIGVEEHEDPYIVEGNSSLVVAGNAFSVEPGIYMTGRWGLRLEDIVLAGETGPEPLNLVDHSLVVVDG